MSRTRLTACVLLPFAAGYFLSYLFRTINAAIATDLAADLNLGAADLGFLTAIYFLVFAAVQLPFGALLDKHGPKTIQSTLLLLASVGALVFALADDLFGLVIGRALLALGVALALMAGFKAIVLWFPPGRVVGANGWLVMLGGLGAVTATAPAEFFIQIIGWRGLFAMLAGLSALTALLVLVVVPDTFGRPGQNGACSASVTTIFRDARFWRIAPLSATGIGIAWSLQGLWAAAWLRDVDGLGRAAIVQHLTAMAIAVCLAALLLGSVAYRLRRVGIATERTLALTIMASMMAQAALAFGSPIASVVLWSIIAATGASTVLSFAVLGEYFPKEVSGRANAALNLLHVTAAFALQSAAGIIIARWPVSDASYASEAHKAAMLAGLCVQLVALGWFAWPRRGLARTRPAYLSHLPASNGYPVVTPVRYVRMHRHERLVRQPDVSWRWAAIASMLVCVGLSSLLWEASSAANEPIQILAADPFLLVSARPPAVLSSLGCASRTARCRPLGPSLGGEP